ncbi:MAG TPA: ABC transporter ATP-binding protein, partial [Fibrobacteria bacterium]|nr:ABC transporter ATP-binding protein [Fibrobacteria bacterium]
MPCDPILELSEVGYFYPGADRRGEPRRWALDGVNLRIGPGERIALLGANGSGKSTLLGHLNGLLRPVRGCVRFHGKPVGYDRRSLAALRAEVAMVFQNADDQLFGATVREDLSFGPVQSGWACERVRSAVDRILGEFALERWADDDPLSLSHGLRRRVAIAGAVAVGPRVLVLDEPTAGLDPAGEDALESTLGSLSGSGTSVVVSTHDVDFALRCAQRVVLLHEGRILANGDARSVLSDREALRTCRLRVPRDLVGMSRVGVAPLATPRGGLHVISLHPSA